MNADRVTAAVQLYELSVKLRHDALLRAHAETNGLPVAAFQKQFVAQHPVEEYFPAALRAIKLADAFMQSNIS